MTDFNEPKKAYEVTADDFDVSKLLLSTAYVIGVPAVAFAIGYGSGAALGFHAASVGAAALGSSIGSSAKNIAHEFKEIGNQLVAWALNDPYLTEELPKADFRPEKYKNS